MSMKLRVAVFVSSVCAIGLFGGAAAPSAEAVGCYKWGCDNKSPVTTDCADDATTVRDSESIHRGSTAEVLGYVQLRYSPTCKAAWSRVKIACDGYDNLPGTTWNTMYRSWDHGIKIGDTIDDFNMPCGAWAYGYMLFVPPRQNDENYKVRGLGEIKITASGFRGERFTSWFTRA